MQLTGWKEMSCMERNEINSSIFVIIIAFLKNILMIMPSFCLSPCFLLSSVFLPPCSRTPCPPVRWFHYPLTLPSSSASKSSGAQCWRSSWWTWWCMPWSAPRAKSTLMLTSGEPASCCGSTSPPSSSSLCCFSLQASLTWCCPCTKRYIFSQIMIKEIT